MKYWNSRRVRRLKERRHRRDRQAFESYQEVKRSGEAYKRGSSRHNAELMLDMLGEERHRRMLAWLRSGGAMSVSKFAKPFHLSLPAAMRYIHLFERVGIISTHKRGRVRFCVYQKEALGELSEYLRSDHALGA